MTGLGSKETNSTKQNAESSTWISKELVEQGKPRTARATRAIDFVHGYTLGQGVVDEMIAAYSQRIFCQCVEIMPQGLAVLEVFDPSVNKWEGIKQVAKIHGIAHEQIMAIGDDVNDLHMIRGAGLGVAMGNAHPQVRAIAKRIIGSNAEDGLAVFLEEVVATNMVEPLQDKKSDAKSNAQSGAAA